MPGVCRKDDTATTGHGCDTTTTVVGPSEDVFCNTRGVERKTDPTAAHTIPNSASPPVCVPHSANITAGSSTVFVNGKAIARVGDSCDAGAIFNGSSNVFAG
tara:strand:- start:197 stop:502 length:306 start_codon:yes stop_codon:yes gene_type:complete